jgi:hypothetical protein
MHYAAHGAAPTHRGGQALRQISFKEERMVVNAHWVKWSMGTTYSPNGQLLTSSTAPAKQAECRKILTNAAKAVICAEHEGGMYEGFENVVELPYMVLLVDPEDYSKVGTSTFCVWQLLI